MADTTAAPSTVRKTVWDFLTSEAFSKCLVLLVTCLVGVAGTLATQRVQSLRAPAVIPVAAPDLPAKPTPISCEQAAHTLDTKLDDILLCLRQPKACKAAK